MAAKKAKGTSVKAADDIDDIEVLLGGFGGQGIILSGLILGKAASLFSDKKSAFAQSYGPEARGGSCSANVIISDDEIDYPYVTHPHHVIIMSQGAYETYVSKLRPDGKLLYDSDLVELKYRRNNIQRFGIPATRLAEGLGRRIVANIVMLGFLTAVTKVVDYDAMKSAILDTVPPGTEDLNLKAYNTGYDHGVKSIERHEKQAKD